MKTATESAEHSIIPINELFPHPSNPRIEPRQEVVEQLTEQMKSGFDQAHSLIVRPIQGGYQIISGHHRLLAAKKSNIEALPCWIRHLSDDEAYMQLVLCNTQSELHPLEEGKHAADSKMDLKAYAAQAGKVYKTIHTKVMAYRVAVVSDIGNDAACANWSNLAEIHAAPPWLRSAMVERMLAEKWTVATTRQTVSGFKACEQPPEWCNADEMAKNLLARQLSIPDIGRIGAYAQKADILDKDLHNSMWKELKEKRPSMLSGVQAIVNKWIEKQLEQNEKKRKKEEAEQVKKEQTAQRIARLQKNCSLDDWGSLNDDEKQALITPNTSDSGTFNKQKNEAIEWAQWSWNPVTGCKHDCPYCYARDIALGERMKKSGLYPNGWEPTFRNAALNSPAVTKVPKQAEEDARFRNVFTCSMADLFGRWVPIEWIESVMGVAHDSPEWNFLFLTKFPQRLKEIEIPDNAWMGTTVDVQARVKNAEKAFDGVDGKVRWLSVEPLIEPLHFERLDLFDWLVIGGASQSKETPAWHPPYKWIDHLVRQAEDAGIPVYMKTNLGIANRIIELPFDAPIKKDPQNAPESFHYLGAQKS